MANIILVQEDSKPTKPCFICKGRIFWNKGWGWICQICHPCPDKEGAEIYEVGKDELVKKDNEIKN